MRAVILAGAAAAFFAGSAHSAIKTYDFTVTVNGVGSPIFGVTGPSDGPFHGSFSVDLPLAPDQYFGNLTLTDFSVTIGTESWVLADVYQAWGKTDAAGDLTLTHLDISAQHFDGAHQEVFNLSIGYYANMGWYVGDYGDGPSFCSFDAVAPYVGPAGGSCLGGGPTDVVVTERIAAVPTPATLPLMGVALVGIAAVRRFSGWHRA